VQSTVVRMRAPCTLLSFIRTNNIVCRNIPHSFLFLFLRSFLSAIEVPDISYGGRRWIPVYCYHQPPKGLQWRDILHTQPRCTLRVLFLFFLNTKKRIHNNARTQKKCPRRPCLFLLSQEEARSPCCAYPSGGLSLSTLFGEAQIWRCQNRPQDSFFFVSFLEVVL